MYEAFRVDESIKRNLKNRFWRINNLYYIKNKEGHRVKFTLNWAQLDLFYGMHNFNVILKARACAPTLAGGGTSH